MTYVPQSVFTSTWRWRTRHGDRQGQPCCVLCVGSRKTALVMFPDGLVTVTSRYAVSPLPPVYSAPAVGVGRAGVV